MKSKAIRTEVWTFSDASFNIVSKRDYGQTGVVTGLMTVRENTEQVFHIFDLASTKQRRVRHSSYGAEILACSDADDRGYCLKASIRSMSTMDKLRHVLHVDSRGLFDTISTLHDGREYCLRQTVQRIRHSFEDGDINKLRWVHSLQNIADALTKGCIQSHRRLNKLCTAGQLEMSTDETREVHCETWV